MQYWTSRGWALVDVNYGGSAGIGIFILSAILSDEEHLMHELFDDFHPLVYCYFKSMDVVISILFLFLEGYGREYRERLLGQWGVVDVNDCCSCATFLVWLIQTDSRFSQFDVDAVIPLLGAYNEKG